MLLIATSSTEADDIKAKVNFKGALFNSTARQALHGRFTGRGEYGPFNTNGKFTGNVSSKPGTRTPEKRLMGRYPVRISVRVASSDRASASDAFDTTVVLRRRSIFNEEVGRIKLRRPINPSKKGRQKISGTGVLKYDF